MIVTTVSKQNTIRRDTTTHAPIARTRDAISGWMLFAMQSPFSVQPRLLFLRP